MWQLQLIPTVQIWVSNVENPDPFESLVMLSATPSPTAGQSWEFQSVTDQGLAMRAGTPLASGGEIITYQTGEESLSMLADEPVPADGSIYTFRTANESLAMLSDDPTPANAQVWEFQSDSDAIAFLSATPTPADGP